MSELRDTGARYEMEEAGLTSYADYRRQDGTLYIDYVYAPPALRGSGASGRLMTAVATEARQKGLSIVPICGFAAVWLQRNREFADLVR
ncbi:MAG: N-acetyltransferase [Proteobacteria bacterium]|nr:N-acetyltransferase [Pseudomonadota bacterium]